MRQNVCCFIQHSTSVTALFDCCRHCLRQKHKLGQKPDISENVIISPSPKVGANCPHFRKRYQNVLMCVYSTNIRFKNFGRMWQISDTTDEKKVCSLFCPDQKMLATEALGFVFATKTPLAIRLVASVAFIHQEKVPSGAAFTKTYYNSGGLFVLLFQVA